MYEAAEFHPDSKSIYVLTAAVGRPGEYLVRRLTLEGEEWPGYRPLPADRGLNISPLGDRMISTTNGVGLMLTDQGELLGARSGWFFQWLPDGRRFRFATEEQWQIGSTYSDRPQEIPIPGLPRWGRPAWSPDGEFVATVTKSNDWRHSWSDAHEVRIYGIDGRLRSMYRITGCHKLQWLTDSSQLAVSVFPHCPAP